MSREGEIARLRRLVDRFGDRMADVKLLLEVIDQKDGRIGDLLAANNALVEQRRVAEGQAEHYQAAMHHMVRLNKTISDEKALLQVKLDTTLVEQQQSRDAADAAWKLAEQNRVEMQQTQAELAPLKRVAELARSWYRSITSLEKARTFENNSAYTRSHLALKHHLALKNSTQEK